jgi:hypothetical protein
MIQQSQRSIQLASIYREGWDDYRDGRTFEECPYRGRSATATSMWEAGFLDAAQRVSTGGGNF